MTDRHCIICGGPGIIALGIRARFANTNAVWAPNLDAYMCAQHAHTGCEIEISITPRADGRVTTRTRGPRGEIASALIIGTGVKVPADQLALA